MRVRHVSDVVGVLSRRRWLAGGVFILVFVYLATSSLRKTPLYEATTQILIEKESRPAASSNAVSKNAELWYDDDFYQTQYKMLQSRTLGVAHAGVDGAGEAAGTRRTAGRQRSPRRISGRAAGLADSRPGSVRPRRSCRPLATRRRGNRDGSMSSSAG
jgi:hypothetical protein